MDTTTTMSSTYSVYTPEEGDGIYRDNTVKVMKNGQWVNAENDVKMDDGVVVYRNGKVIKGDKEVELHDGEIVNKAGNFFNRSGEAFEDAWDATK